MAHSFLTPVGRLVSGSFFTEQKTDHQNKPLDPSKYNYFVALAFPKTSADWRTEGGDLGAVFAAMRQAAADGFRGQENVNPAFKWKIDDGDNPKHADKVGYKGCWVLKFSRQASIGPCPVYNNNTPPAPIINPDQAKRGSYYRISGSTSANGATGDQMGVYLNMEMAQWCAFGEEIVSGPSAAQVFGAAPVTLPPGASATPAAPVNAMPATPAVTPGTTPAPNFAQGGGYAPTPAAPAAPVKYQFSGGAYTKEALLQAGHTEAMITTYPVAP